MPVPKNMHKNVCVMILFRCKKRHSLFICGMNTANPSFGHFLTLYFSLDITILVTRLGLIKVNIYLFMHLNVEAIRHFIILKEIKTLVLFEGLCVLLTLDI